MKKSDINKLIGKEKTQIMEQFIKNCPFERWSENNLKISAVNCGFESGYSLILFPEGIKDFTQYFINSMNEDLLIEFNKSNEFIKTNDKITYLIELKLQKYAKIKEAIRNLLQFYVLPHNILLGQKHLWQTCDQIWYLAGDKSIDFNHYSKRLILAKIYSSTLLYWLSDESEGYKSTKLFLREQINNTKKIGKFKSSINNFIKILSTDNH